MFRNPITSLPASAITSGTFTGTYQNAGTFILAGTPGASRIEASGSELAFYGADGITKLIDLDTSSGAGAINSATITGGLIQTAAPGAGLRVALDGAQEALIFGTGTGTDGRLAPAVIVSGLDTYQQLQLQAPLAAGSPSAAASLTFRANAADGNSVQLDSGDQNFGLGISLTGADVLIGRKGNPSGSAYARDDLIVSGYTGTPNASGIITVNFPRTMAVAPGIIPVCRSGANQIRVVSNSTTGFTAEVRTAAGALVTSGTVSIYYAAIMS